MNGPDWIGLLQQQRRYSDLDKAREELMIAAMLTGEECTLLGRRVRIRLEWIDDPGPFTEDTLRTYGESMKASAQRRLAS